MQRRVLIVSPYFPPSTLAGVHRARHLAKHLPAAGWEPTIVCVDEKHHEQQLDPALAALVPSTVDIRKVGALSAEVSRKIGIGEVSLRAWQPLRRAISETLSAQRYDAVMITGSPYYPMLLSRGLSRRFGVPIVLDFQDPWVSSWGAQLPALSKGGISHRLAALLEPAALRGASFITSVSETQNAEMGIRYPWLDASRMEAIPIGGDPDDFVALRQSMPEESAGDLDPAFTNLSFVGAFMPRTGPLMRSLFRAFRAFRDEHPQLAAKVRLNFVGTSNQPGPSSKHVVMPLASEAGVAEHVRETPGRLPYLRALAVLARSDGLLLIGSDEPHYTASKIYPGLMSGRPYISFFHGLSSAHEILAAADGGISLSFRDAEEIAMHEPALSQAFFRLASDPGSLGPASRAAYAPYEAGAVAQRFASVFERLA